VDISSFNPDEFATGLRSLGRRSDTVNEADRVAQVTETPSVQGSEHHVVMSEDKLREMLDEVASKASAQATAALSENAGMNDMYAMTRLMAGMQAGAAMTSISSPAVRGGERRSTKFSGAAAILLAGAIGAGVVLAGQQYLSDDSKVTAEEVQATGGGGMPSRVYYSAVNSNIEQNTVAHQSGTAAMVERLEDGTFVADGTPVSWNVLTVSPDGTRYSVELAIPSPVGGFQPDKSLQERLHDADISDEELARFLLANTIVVAKQAGLYVEIVGATTTNDGERLVLKTIELTA